MASCKKKNECKTKYKKKMMMIIHSEDECKITHKRKNDDDDCKIIKCKKK